MATISATTYFNISASPKSVLWVDSSDWAGQGISTSDVNGCFKITPPSGIPTYNNTNFSNGACDIRIGVSPISQQSVQLPLNVLGNVESGTYTILYSVYNSDTDETYTQSYTFTFNYESPEVEIENTANCYSPVFTSTDLTDYEKSGAEVVITRTHTLNYPYGSAGEDTPIVSSERIIATSTFYNGTQTTEISTGLIYTYTDGLIITDTVTGSKELLVDCQFMCDLSCCITTLEQIMNGYKTTNQTQYAIYSETFQQVMSYMGLIKYSLECGLYNSISNYVTIIKTLAHCTDDCQCSDTPSQVMGIGFTNLDVVVSTCGNGIDVNTTIIGDTTTYQVCLSDATVELLNSGTHTVVAEGNNITVSSATVGVTTTYTVNGVKTTLTSTDGTVIITPTGPVAGVTNYDLSVITIADGEASAISQTVSSASYTSITSATATIPTDGDGDYLFWTELVAQPGVSSVFKIAYHVNGVLAGTERTFGDTATVGVDRSSFSYCINERLDGLVATDIITVKIKKTTGDTFPITGQSVQYLKIA